MAEFTGLNQIGQIAVNVHDLKKPVTFYRDVLGLRFLFEAPPRLAFFDCAGVRLMLDVAENPESDHLSSVLYFRVNDIQHVFTTLKSRGFKFEGEPHLIARMPDHDHW